MRRMNVRDPRRSQRQSKRRVLEESTKEMTKRGSKGPRTKHLLHVHQECRKEVTEMKVIKKSEVLSFPLSKTLALIVRVPRIFMFLSRERRQTRGSCDIVYSEGTGHGSWRESRDSESSGFMNPRSNGIWLMLEIYSD